MKHTIELKMPKIFGKKTSGDTEVRTEVNLRNKDENLKTIMSIAGPIVVLSLVYLVGFKAGVLKGGTSVVVFKD